MYAARFTEAEHSDAFYAIMQGLSIICRFTFRLVQFSEPGRSGVKHFVKVENVRLKQSKPYCGSHAGPCQINPAFEKPHHKMAFLEGADWVAFNDMVNDAIDLIGVNAWVSSSACVIRISDMRCVEYKGKDGADFDKIGYYENKMKEQAKAKYPNGTPGIDTWRA